MELQRELRRSAFQHADDGCGKRPTELRAVRLGARCGSGSDCLQTAGGRAGSIFVAFSPASCTAS